MVVADRIRLLDERIAQGYDVCLTFSTNPMTGRIKVKARMGPAAGAIAPEARRAMQSTLTPLRTLLAIAVVVDRGHTYSDGHAIVSFWATPHLVALPEGGPSRDDGGDDGDDPPDPDRDRPGTSERRNEVFRGKHANPERDPWHSGNGDPWTTAKRPRQHGGGVATFFIGDENEFAVGSQVDLPSMPPWLFPPSSHPAPPDGVAEQGESVLTRLESNIDELFDTTLSLCSKVDLATAGLILCANQTLDRMAETDNHTDKQHHTGRSSQELKPSVRPSPSDWRTLPPDHWACIHTRFTSSKAKLETIAAVTIQKHFRGFQGRHRAAILRMFATFRDEMQAANIELRQSISQSISQLSTR